MFLRKFLFLFKGKMFWVCPLVFVAILKCTSAGQTIRGSAVLEHDWAEAFKLIINVPMQYSVPDGWRMALIFSQPIRKVEVWRAIELKEKTSADKKTHALKNMYFNTRVAKGPSPNAIWGNFNNDCGGFQSQAFRQCHSSV